MEQIGAAGLGVTNQMDKDLQIVLPKVYTIYTEND